MISAQPLDLAHESAGPSRLTLPVRPSRARLEPLLPTVERGPARPDGAGRPPGPEPARAGAPPAVERGAAPRGGGGARERPGASRLPAGSWEPCAVRRDDSQAPR